MCTSFGTRMPFFIIIVIVVRTFLPYTSTPCHRIVVLHSFLPEDQVWSHPLTHSLTHPQTQQANDNNNNNNHIAYRSPVI